VPPGGLLLEPLRGRALERSLVEDASAGGTNLPLDLVRDARALPQSVLDDGGMPVPLVWPSHLH
jgi:hypothetical protein